MRKVGLFLMVSILFFSGQALAWSSYGQRQPATIQLRKDYGEDANFTLSIYRFDDGTIYLNISAVVNGNLISLNAYDENGGGVDWFTQVASVGRFTFYQGDVLRRHIAEYTKLKTKVIPDCQVGVRNGTDSFVKVRGKPIEVLNYLNGILSTWRTGHEDFVYAIEEGKRLADLIFTYPPKWREFYKDHKD